MGVSGADERERHLGPGRLYEQVPPPEGTGARGARVCAADGTRILIVHVHVLAHITRAHSPSRPGAHSAH